MNLWLALVSRKQPTNAVQPRERAFDNPSVTPQMRRRLDTLACNAWLNTSLS